VQKRFFSQSCAKQYLHAASFVLPLRRAASDPLDLSDEPNQDRDADVTLQAFGGVPLSFGL
jgi:hypothetical protein